MAVIESSASSSAAPNETESVHFHTCPLCEATCGLEISIKHRDDGTTSVGRIRGDRDDVFSKGFICPKGSTVKQLHEDPDRLRRPVIRRGDDPATATWEEVTWDEAFAEVERGLTAVLDQHGRDAVAVYLGNPSAHTVSGILYGRPLLRALGTRNIYSASTVDQMPKHVSSGLLFGSGDTIPVPDLDRTDYLLMLGANPYESNGSLCTAPDFPGRLDAIRARGGRVVVVDPRVTKTAKAADEHLFIRPGTDGHLLLGVIAVLFADDLVDLGPLADHTSGVDAVRDLVAPFTPDAVAAVTGVDAATIVRLAHDLAGAPSAAVYGRIGANTVRYGTLTSWAGDVINVLTGNLDRPGGAMFPLAAHSRADTDGPGRGFVTGRHHSRVSGHPEVRSELPVAALAEEIETPGEGQIRALVTVAGNPAMSTPNSERLADALATLDFMVSVDPYLNETTRHANVILPGPTPLERSSYDFAFYTLSVRNIANYSPAVLETDQLDESDILARLALIAGGQGADADPAIIHGMLEDALLQRAVGEGTPLAGRDPATLAAELVAVDPPDRLIEIMIRTGAYGDHFGLNPDGMTLAKLLDNPHGIDLGPLQPRIPGALKTASGTIELMSDLIAGDLARAAAALDVTDDGSLLLVGRRHLRSNNSWMHNVNVLVKGKERCTLQVHPSDASRLGLVEGASAKVASRVGAVTAPVEITDEVMAGVVSLPHGWGHDLPGTRLSVAAARPGVNSNILTDESDIDPLSGNAVLNGIPVTVAPA
jgi:anaerobic selenocysteine-containing dehydrogenase